MKHFHDYPSSAGPVITNGQQRLDSHSWPRGRLIIDHGKFGIMSILVQQGLIAQYLRLVPVLGGRK